MRKIETLRVIPGDGWRGWDRQARKHGLRRGSIVNPLDPYLVIYYPLADGYANSGVRARELMS